MDLRIQWLKSKVTSALMNEVDEAKKAPRVLQGAEWNSSTLPSRDPFQDCLDRDAHSEKLNQFLNHPTTHAYALVFWAQVDTLEKVLPPLEVVDATFETNSTVAPAAVNESSPSTTEEAPIDASTPVAMSDSAPPAPVVALPRVVIEEVTRIHMGIFYFPSIHSL
jgi:hypothetical protein